MFGPQACKMSNPDYDTQATYAAWVREAADDRRKRIAAALGKAFEGRSTPFGDISVDTEKLSAKELSDVVSRYPEILKALAVAAGVATRAIERDLDIPGLDLYEPSLTADERLRVVAYLKTFLDGRPLSLSALAELDRAEFVDKEIRKLKGQWRRP